MKAQPCEMHNTWTDFPGGGGCVRCGWSEKAVEVRELEKLIDNPQKYASVPRPDALQSMWKREMGGTDGLLVQPVTEEEMAKFLADREGSDT